MARSELISKWMIIHSEFLFYSFLFLLENNEIPTADAGPDQFIYLPTRSCVIDGRKSHDDEYIESYKWTRNGLSPAAGVNFTKVDFKV